MGMTSTVENSVQENGGIDVAHLPRRELIRLDGERTATFQAVMRQSVLNKIHAHGDSSPDAEVCGVLVGDVYQDDFGPFVLVEQMIQGEAAAESIGQVTFTAATWQHIQLEMDKHYPDLRIVGWYHTHPGHGVFLSEMDVFLHESFFGLPWQMAVVYDPKSGEEGMFAAAKGKSHKLGYLVEGDESQTTKIAQYNIPVPEVKIEAPKRKKAKRFFKTSFRIGLALVGLVLFTALGVLLGLLVKMQHIEIPYWIQHMVHN
jgi:proteasome lid subunit RPN8/RPN11